MTRLLDHFGFRHNPFARNTPKDALLRHSGFTEALARLRYCVQLEAFAVLVAESGCGKSLLLGELADELRHDSCCVHYFAHATVGPFGLVNVLARKVGLSPRRSRAETAAMLSEHLMSQKTQHIVILDEAHEFPDKTLDDIRLLTVADYDRKGPFLLLLAGQLPLDDRLADPSHRALDMRVTTIARLLPLSADETRQYVNTRLAAAGVKKRQPVFEPDAVDAIAQLALGIPRRINSLATSTLIVAASRDRRVVNAQDVHDAHADRGRP